MKEFKGTTGKWSFSHGSASDDNVACIGINSSESLHEIAYLQSTPSSIGKYEQTSFDKTIANAHLIASAPDLLAALQEMTAIVKKNSYPQPDKPSSNYARAVWAESIISKALGEE